VVKRAFEVLFNDEYVLVINKRAKLLVHPSPKREKYTLTSILESALKETVYPCHRLDRETTGLIVYAKNKDIQKKIMEQFRKRLVKKEYFAFIKGSLKNKKGFFDDYILDKEGARFGEKRKRAKAYYELIESFQEFSLIKLIPLTGRTNQLRIQLAKRRTPILGERKYAFRKDFVIKEKKYKGVDFKRLALHASFLSFIHPISRETVEIRIDLPEDMKNFLKLHRMLF